jgi:hypothetical protein
MIPGRSLHCMVGFNILHLVLPGCSLPCVRFTLSEARHRPLRRWRLAAPVLFALACALVFLLFHLGARDPAWTFFAAMGAGLLLGAARGLTLQPEVDHMLEKVRLPRAQGSPFVALCLVAAVLFEIGGAFLGAMATPVREFVPEVAALCAGILTGRACAIAFRWRRTPHIDLRRA